MIVQNSIQSMARVLKCLFLIDFQYFSFTFLFHTFHLHAFFKFLLYLHELARVVFSLFVLYIFKAFILSQLLTNWLFSSFFVQITGNMLFASVGQCELIWRSIGRVCCSQQRQRIHCCFHSSKQKCSLRGRFVFR